MANLYALFSFTLLCVCAASKSASAAPPARHEHRVDCPAKLPPEALPLAVAPPGWTAFSRGGLLLHAVDITDGPPSEGAFLKPDDATVRHGKGVDLWPNLQDMRELGSVWLACNYGNSDQVILGKRLDNNVSECRAIYTKDEFGGYNIEVRCKW